MVDNRFGLDVDHNRVWKSVNQKDIIMMELSINNKMLEPPFWFEHTKSKLGVRIWGDKRSFHDLHELFGQCWDCENADMSHAYGTYQYDDYMSTLKKHAKKLDCPIEELRAQVNESVYDIEL